jgi:hypothetical protein
MVLGRRSWAAALELASQCPTSARDVEHGGLINLSAGARAVHLAAVRAVGFSPTTLSRRMQHSAVAVFGQYDTGRGKHDHVMVVTLLRGDLDHPESVTIGVHDPWASGTRWTGPWNEWFGPRRVLLRADWMVSR